MEEVHNAQLQYMINLYQDPHMAAATAHKDNRKTISRHKFSPDDDDKLKAAVARLGESDWNAVAAEVPGRTSRQCRDRWKKYLKDEYMNPPWTPEEDLILEQKYNELGPKWATIAKFFNMRTDNNVKNRWVTRGGREKKKVIPADIPDHISIPHMLQPEMLRDPGPLVIPQLTNIGDVPPQNGLSISEVKQETPDQFSIA